jgi:hypothetical protein
MSPGQLPVSCFIPVGASAEPDTQIQDDAPYADSNNPVSVIEFESPDHVPPKNDNPGPGLDYDPMDANTQNQKQQMRRTKKKKPIWKQRTITKFHQMQHRKQIRKLVNQILKIPRHIKL